MVTPPPLTGRAPHYGFDAVRATTDEHTQPLCTFMHELDHSLAPWSYPQRGTVPGPSPRASGRYSRTLQAPPTPRARFAWADPRRPSGSLNVI